MSILSVFSCFVLVCFKTIAQNAWLAGTVVNGAACNTCVDRSSGHGGRLEPLRDQPNGQLVVALLDTELAGLRNLGCTRTVTRSWRDEPGGALHRIDVIGAVGGYVDGQDEETAVTRNGRQLKRTMRELKGSWSTGEFGAILAEESAAIANGRLTLTVTETGDAYVIHYRVPASDSEWNLHINGWHWRPGYDGTISVGKATRHIIRVARSVDEIAPECPVWRFRWQVDYEPRVINERPVSVPVRALYENCQRDSGRCSVNETVFSDYREFRSIATITFADVGPSAPSPAGGTGSPAVRGSE